MAKTLVEIFAKYDAPERHAAWMLTATDIRMRADKERRMLEVSAAFPALVKKSELYAAECDIAKVYELSHVRILPRYPAELFGELLGEIFAYGLEGSDRLVTYECGFRLGKFILLADAIDVVSGHL